MLRRKTCQLIDDEEVAVIAIALLRAHLEGSDQALKLFKEGKPPEVIQRELEKRQRYLNQFREPN